MTSPAKFEKINDRSTFSVHENSQPKVLSSFDDRPLNSTQKIQRSPRDEAMYQIPRSPKHSPRNAPMYETSQKIANSTRHGDSHRIGHSPRHALPDTSYHSPKNLHQTHSPRNLPQTHSPRNLPQTHSPRNLPQTHSPRNQPAHRSPRTQPAHRSPRTLPQTHSPRNQPSQRSSRHSSRTGSPKNESHRSPRHDSFKKQRHFAHRAPIRETEEVSPSLGNDLDSPPTWKKNTSYESNEDEKPRIVIRGPSDDYSEPMDEIQKHEVKKSMNMARSPKRNITTKTWKKGGTTYKTSTTTYKTRASPGGKNTMVREYHTSSGAESPTKRMIDHKNAALKHKINASKNPGYRDKMLYTVDPHNSYVVNRDYPQNMSRDEIINKTMGDRQGFSERHVGEDGSVTNKYYYSSPQSHKVDRSGRLVENTKQFNVSPSKKVHAQEFYEDPNYHDIMSPDRNATRRDFIKEMEDRTRQIQEDFDRQTQMSMNESPSHTKHSERYHNILRDNLSRSFHDF